MNATMTTHGYRIGEEVVVRLDAAAARDAGLRTPPDWTIGEIVACTERDGAPAYAIRVRDEDDVWHVIVPEDAVEGTA